MGIPHRWRTSDGILDVRFPYTREMVDRVRTLTIGDPRDIRTIVGRRSLRLQRMCKSAERGRRRHLRGAARPTTLPGTAPVVLDNPDGGAARSPTPGSKKGMVLSLLGLADEFCLRDDLAGLLVGLPDDAVRRLLDLASLLAEEHGLAHHLVGA